MSRPRTSGHRGRGLSRPFLVLGLMVGSSQGGEFVLLKQDRDLTPQRLLSRVADFAYELGDGVQDAETFLRRRRGDCDDFANLADQVLTERGWQAKLVVVMMEGQTHVVCYVREAPGFLDFNRRALPDPIVLSDGSLEDIAEKVAASFRSRWWTVAEFEYRDGSAVFLQSAFPPPSLPAAAVQVEATAVSLPPPASAGSPGPPLAPAPRQAASAAAGPDPEATDPFDVGPPCGGR